MSYLSIKHIRYDYISLKTSPHDVMSIEYIHPSFETRGLMIPLSNFKFHCSESSCQLIFSTDKDISKLQSIESHLKHMSKETEILPILTDNCISFPKNHITHSLSMKKLTSGYLTFKVLRYKYGKHKAILHLNH